MTKENKNTNGRIIIADDESTFCKSTAQLLQKEGFSCVCAENSSEALEKIKTDDYDLLIADIKMPGNTNLELIKLVTESENYISIIVITAYPSEQTAIKAVSLPVTAYLTKPLNFDQLIETVKSAVRINRLRKAVVRMRRDLQLWAEQLQAVEMALNSGKNDSFKNALKNYLDITEMAAQSLFAGVKETASLLDNNTAEAQVCDMMNCEKLDQLIEGIKQTVRTLDKSRHSHRSGQLKDIRVKLEKLLKNIQKN